VKAVTPSAKEVT